MKKILLVTLILLFFSSTVTAEEQDIDSHLVFMPAIVQTQTLPYYVKSDSWIFVTIADNYADNILLIYGVKPSKCYDLDWYYNGNIIDVRALRINPIFCDSYDYSQPEILDYNSPDRGYGEQFKLVLNTNSKYVCGSLNCVDVLDEN